MKLKASRGFTLVEVVVALTVLSLISLATLAAMRTFGTTQQKLDLVSDRTQEMRVVNQFLRRVLADPQPVLRQTPRWQYSYFHGDQQQLIWVAPFAASRYIGGLTVFRLEANEEGQLTVQFAPYLAPDKEPNWSELELHVLVQEVDQFRLAYRSAPGKEWLESWDGMVDNPDSLRLSIAANGRYWPDIIIRLNETFSANTTLRF